MNCIVLNLSMLDDHTFRPQSRWALGSFVIYWLFNPSTKAKGVWFTFVPQGRNGTETLRTMNKAFIDSPVQLHFSDFSPL